MTIAETFPDKIAAVLKPLVKEEARRIVQAKADSPEERAARREAYEINHAGKAVAEAVDALTYEAKTAGQRAMARQKLITAAGKLRKVMLRYGRISAREAE